MIVPVLPIPPQQCDIDDPPLHDMPVYRIEDARRVRRIFGNAEVFDGEMFAGDGAARAAEVHIVRDHAVVFMGEVDEGGPLRSRSSSTLLGPCRRWREPGYSPARRLSGDDPVRLRERTLLRRFVSVVHDAVPR
jgi:hypothetical protein